MLGLRRAESVDCRCPTRVSPLGLGEGHSRMFDLADGRVRIDRCATESTRLNADSGSQFADVQFGPELQLTLDADLIALAG